MFEGEEAASHPWSYAVRKPWCALRPSFAHVSWPVRFSIHACVAAVVGHPVAEKSLFNVSRLSLCIALSSPCGERARAWSWGRRAEGVCVGSWSRYGGEFVEVSVRGRA